MAKPTDAQGINWFGTKFNTQQMVLGIPGGSTANTGGIAYLERIDSSGDVQTGIWLHTDGTNLRVSTGATKPSNTESGGTALGATTGADTALSNLASVQIPNAGDLIPANDNQVTLGDATHGFSVGYLSTSLVFIESTNSLTITASDCVSNAVTANFPDVSGTSTTPVIMLDTASTNSIAYANGTASIGLGAAADITLGAAAQLDIGAAADVDFGTGAVSFTGTAAFDQATGTTVNIDQNLTVQGGALTTSSACTLDQNLAAAQSPTWVGLTLTGAIATPTDITMSGALATPTSITTSGAITIDGDSTKLRLGDTPASDSYIMHVAAGDLTFYDPVVATTYTLSQLVAGTPLNPIVTGDLTISDGQFDWVNTATADTNTWDFGATTVDTFDIVCDNTTAAFLDIEADSFTAHGTAAEGLIDINVDSITSGNVIVIDTNQAGTFTGSYLKFYTDGSTDAFTVKGYGATVIAGVARGTDALTLTAGDLKVTDGWLDIDSGNTDGGHNIATSANATNNTDFITITNSDAAFDKQLVNFDANMTGAVDAIALTYEGTAAALHITTGNAAGWGIDFDVAASHTDPLIYMDLGTWLGSTDEGVIHMFSDSAGHIPAGQFAIMHQQGTGQHAAAIAGTMLDLTDAATAPAVGTSYMVYISATNIEALHVDVGLCQFDEGFTAGVAGTAGAVTVYGTCTLGADADAGNGDFKWFGHTTNKFVVFDETADDVIFADATGLILGGDESTADGVKMEFDGTATLNIDCLTANDTIVIGATTDTNMQWEDSASNLAMDWDAGADTFTIQADTWLVVTGKATGDGDTGLVIPYHATASPSANAKVGAIQFEVDAKKLWVNTDGAGNWVGVTLA